MKNKLFTSLFAVIFLLSAVVIVYASEEENVNEDPQARILKEIKQRAQVNNVENEEDSNEVDSNNENSLNNEVNSNIEDEVEDKVLSLDEKRQKINEVKAMKKTKRCEILKDRVNLKINRYDGNYVKYVKNYESLYIRIDNLLKKVEGKGYDTEALEEDLVMLRTKIDEIKQMQADFATKMRLSAQNYACDNDLPKQFQNVVEEAKMLLSQTRIKAKELHTFVLTKIKPDLQALKAEISADKADDVNDDSAETNGNQPKVNGVEDSVMYDPNDENSDVMN